MDTPLPKKKVIKIEGLEEALSGFATTLIAGATRAAAALDSTPEERAKVEARNAGKIAALGDKIKTLEDEIAAKDDKGRVPSDKRDELDLAKLKRELRGVREHGQNYSTY